MNFNKKTSKFITVLILEAICIPMLFSYGRNINTMNIDSLEPTSPIIVIIGLCTLCAWSSFWNIVFRFEKTPNLYEITFKDAKKISTRKTNITVIKVTSFFLFAFLLSTSRTAQMYNNDALLNSFFSCIGRCAAGGMFSDVLSGVPLRKYNFGTGKIYQYTEEYMEYFYSNNETNIDSIILYFVSVYLDTHKKNKLPDSEVARTSLEIIYDSILPEIETYKSDEDGKLSEVGQALLVFLFDVIKRQLSHDYISSEEYTLRINELSAL